MAYTFEMPPLSTPESSSTVFDGIMFQLPLEEIGPPKPLPRVDDYESMNSTNVVHLPNSPLNTEFWARVCETYKSIPKTFSEFRLAVCSYNEDAAEAGWSSFQNLFENSFPKEKQNHFFEVLLPKIVALALTLPEEVTRPVPLLGKHVTKSLSLSQKQIGVLMANAFLSTFLSRRHPQHAHYTSSWGDFGEINFDRFFSRVYKHVSEQKWNCFMNYFERITTSEPDGVVTFTRQYMPKETMPRFSNSEKPLVGFKMETKGLIEETKDHLLVDFADEYVGGIILTSGCVQEEILFLKYPELIIARLFTIVLDKTEALIVTGAEQYNAGKGYGSSYEFSGNFHDDSPRDELRRRRTRIVAIDALNLSTDRTIQYKAELMLREIEKAYAGFCRIDGTKGPLEPVATGNWGCGVFGGDVNLKSLLQLIAASEAGRAVRYFTFGEDQLVEDLGKLYQFLIIENVTVGKLTSILLSYADEQGRLNEKDLLHFYPFIKQKVKGKKTCVSM